MKKVITVTSREHVKAPMIVYTVAHPEKGFIIWGPSTRDNRTHEWISEYTGLAEIFESEEAALDAIHKEGVSGADYQLISVVVEVEYESVKRLKFESDDPANIKAQ